MVDVETVFPNFHDLSEENQRMLSDVKENKMGEVRRAFEDLSTLLSGESIHMKEYDTGTTQVPRGFPRPRVVYFSLQNPFEEHLMIKLLNENGLYDLPQNQQRVVQEFILDCQKFKMDIDIADRVYRLINVLYADLCYLLTYLDDSLNISEGMLKCIEQVSDKAKKAIDGSFILVSRKDHRIHFLCDALTFFGGGQINANFAQAVEQIVCIKAEISSKHRNVDDKVPSLKSPAISKREPKEEIMVDFADEELILERLITNDTQPVGSLQRMEVHYCGINIEALAKELQEQVEGIDVIIRTDQSQHHPQAER